MSAGSRCGLVFLLSGHGINHFAEGVEVIGRVQQAIFVRIPGFGDQDAVVKPVDSGDGSLFVRSANGFARDSVRMGDAQMGLPVEVQLIYGTRLKRDSLERRVWIFRRPSATIQNWGSIVPLLENVESNMNVVPTRFS